MEQANVLGQVFARTLVSISDLKWHNKEKTILDCMVVFKELERFGPMPFSTHENEDTPWGKDIWDRAVAGEFGPIAEAE